MLVHAEVHPRGGDEVRLADDVLSDQVADLVHRRAVEEGVSRHQHQAALLAHRQQLGGVTGQPRQRLLYQDVLAGRERPRGELEVGRWRGRDQHRLHPRVAEDRLEIRLHGIARVAALELARAALSSISHSANSSNSGRSIEVAD